MGEKALTVKGLQKEQKELLAAYLSADEILGKARAAHKTAKDKLVDFNNGYGRVLEVLDAAE